MGNAGIGGISTRVWLERGGVIVDVTADQFRGIREKVIVTRKSKWHATWKNQQIRGPADFRLSADPGVFPLWRMYEIIKTPTADQIRVGYSHLFACPNLRAFENRFWH